MNKYELKLEDVNLHNKKKDCWIVLYGNVYDITEYMKIHPGDFFPLQVAGKDGTGLFESIHPKKTKQMLHSEDFKNKYYKGFIKNYKLMNNFDYDSQFGHKLKNEIEKYFVSVKNTPLAKGGRNEQIVVYSKFLIITGLTLFSKYYQLKTKESVYSILYAISMILTIGNISHGANHGELIQNYPFIFSKISEKYQWILGNNNNDWKKWHNVSHHQHTNTAQDGDMNRRIFVRMHHNFRYKFYHKYQHFYSWFLYLLTHIFAFVLENNQYKGYIKYILFNLFLSSIINGSQPFYYSNKILLKSIFSSAYIIIPASKFYKSLPVFAISLPIIYTSELYGLLTSFILEAMSFGLLFTLINHVTHDNDLTHYNDTCNSCWYENQVRSTANWSCDNLLITHLTGGINHQIEHHLCQSVHHYHYPALRKIVKKIIKENNIPYYEFPDFKSALFSHYKLLKKNSIKSTKEL